MSVLRTQERLESMFAALDDLDSIGSGGHSGSADKSFILDFSKFFGYEVEEFELEGKDRLADWKWRVKAALSDRLPKAFRGKRRPAERDYPFLDTGALRSGVHVGMTASLYGKSKAKIKFWADLTDPAARLTNLNIRGRSDGSTTNWLGWIDRVFETGDSTRGIISIRDIFNTMVNSRRRNRGSR